MRIPGIVVGIIGFFAVGVLSTGCAPQAVSAEAGGTGAPPEEGTAPAERLAAVTELRSRGLEERVFSAQSPRETADGSWTVENLASIGGGLADAYALRYTAEEMLFGDATDRPSVVLELVDAAGRAEPISLLVRPGVHDVVVRPEVWGVDAAQLLLRSEIEGFDFVSITPIPEPTEPFQAIPIEMSELLHYPRDSWRRDDFELFSWSLYPEILWIDSRDYATQAAMFKRMAFFIEKRGVLGRLLSDEELSGLHGWNAHNYRGEGLAAFFNAVEREDFPINELEETVRDIVADHGIIRRGDGESWVAGSGGILAISQESYPELRRLLLSHESMHGVFYWEQTFRTAVERYWNDALSERERAYWRSFFAWMGYSPEDEYLMVNEFQAYLLQQDESAVRWYFRTRIADRLRSSVSVGPAIVNAFLTDHPRTFVNAASAMNEALFQAAGMVGGDPFCLRPIGTEG